MFEALAAEVPAMLTAPGLDGAGNPWTWGGYSSAIAISVFGFSLWPHYFMKIYTARDVRTLKKTVVFYPTFMIFLVPIMFIGFSGILRFPGVTPTDAILPTIITSLDLPAVVVGLFCAGALAASMSTGDALVHAAGCILVNDLYKVWFRPDIDDVTERRLIRFLVIVIAGVAYYFAAFSDYSLVGLLLYSYGFLSQFFPLLLAAFFWPRATRPGVIAGLLAGCAVVLLMHRFPGLQWQQIDPGIFGLVANSLVMIGVSLATEPMSEEHVEQFVVT
jgi:SSS family solute:Na+ symporter